MSGKGSRDYGCLNAGKGGRHARVERSGFDRSHTRTEISERRAQTAARARALSVDRAVLAQPVLDEQTWHSRKLSQVVRDQGEAERPSMRRNDEIVRTDRASDSL